MQLAAQPRCDVRPRLPAEDPQRTGWCCFQAAPRSPLQHGLTRWHAPPELRRAAMAGPGPRAPGSWPAPRCHAHSCRTTRRSALRPPLAGRGGRLHPEPWQVPEAGAPLHPGPSPTPALGTPKPPPSSRGEPTRSPGHQARGQERRANASAACPQPLTGVFQVTEAAHLHPSLIITAWWPGAQAPVWSSHNASGVETSRQAPASLCFRRRGDQGHHPGVTCAATGRDVRDPARALAPRTEKRAHRQPHGAPRQAPVSPRPASA